MADAPAPTDDAPRQSLNQRHSSAVLDRLRAAQAASDRPDMPAVPATPTTSAAALALAQAAAAETVPASQPTLTSSLAAHLAASGTVAQQRQRTSPDAGGDSSPGFAFNGQTAPRPAGPVLQGPSAMPTFASLVNSMQLADALPADTSTQIVQAIRMQMLRDGGEAHIRLDPRQFGDMTVRIRVDQGQVTARVEADTPVVREWLQSNQHVLRQSLAGQQLTLDRLEVHEPPESNGGRQEDPSEREQDRRQQRDQRRRRPDTGELFEVVA